MQPYAWFQITMWNRFVPSNIPILFLGREIEAGKRDYSENDEDANPAISPLESERWGLWIHEFRTTYFRLGRMLECREKKNRKKSLRASSEHQNPHASSFAFSMAVFFSLQRFLPWFDWWSRRWNHINASCFPSAGTIESLYHQMGNLFKHIPYPGGGIPRWQFHSLAVTIFSSHTFSFTVTKVSGGKSLSRERKSKRCRSASLTP